MAYLSSGKKKLLGSNTEGKGIDFWQPNTEYKLNDLCLYKETNYYSVYICVTEHTSADAFVSAYWETIDGTEFEGYTEDEILAMLNLSQDELITLQSLIDDTEITTLKTWSSSNTYTYIQDAIKVAKEYTEKMLNRYNKVSFLIVTSLNDMTETGYIYLMDNGSGTFDMYIVQDDATVVPIGNMNVDLAEYTKTEELERDYLKIADAEGTYAKITTVDNLIQEVDDLGLMKPVNENWIINGDFKVWSNGENFTTSTECIYTADRWKTQGFAFIDISKTDDGIMFVNNSQSSALWWIKYYFDKVDFSRARGNVMSVTIRLRKSRNFGLRVSYLIGGEFLLADLTDIGTEWTTITKTITIPDVDPPNPDEPNFGFVSDTDIIGGEWFEIDYVKMELGEVATPHTPRLYAEEVMLCERYGNEENLIVPYISSTWNNVGSSTSSDIITLPNSYSELAITVSNTINNNSFSFNLASVQTGYFNNSYYESSSNYGYVKINKTTTTINIEELNINGVSSIGDATLTVWYR